MILTKENKNFIIFVGNHYFLNKIMKIKRTVLFILLILISLSAYADMYSIKWILDENKFVTTKPNATVYQVGTYKKEKYDTWFANLRKDSKFRTRNIIDYTSHKTKNIKKARTFKVRGFANKNKQFHYDTYVIEIKGYLYYLPIVFA